MRWANFLHIYQPYNQQPDILEAVTAQSYRPLIENLAKYPETRLTININGSLLELFDKYGYHDLIEGLAKAYKSGQVEFTGSAKYHALLPFLSKEEVLRQIEINNITLRHYLGEDFKPAGIFLPEMAYDPKLAPWLEEAGFKWMIIDEIAFGGKVEAVDYTNMYKVKGTGLHVMFRERRTSNLIMSAVVRTKESLEQAMEDDIKSDRYVITGMDGETFGHHRPGLENLLFELFDAPELGMVRMSDLLEHYPEVVETEPVACTWASSPQDIADGIQFISWDDPTNPIHKLQWKLRDYVLEQFYTLPQDDAEWPKLRGMLDIALASDQFFWASAKPWWSIEMIEEGAYRLLEILQHLNTVGPYGFEEGESLYHQIVAAAFDWKRSGHLLAIEREREGIMRIPFKERTLEKGGAEPAVYHAFIDMMKTQEAAAKEKGDYEAAILWRDAIYKLDKKVDMFEAIHAVDLLRTKIGNDVVEDTIAKYKSEYLRVRGGQPEQRGAS
jgi:hypothetical protein